MADSGSGSTGSGWTGSTTAGSAAADAAVARAAARVAAARAALAFAALDRAAPVFPTDSDFAAAVRADEARAAAVRADRASAFGTSAVPEGAASVFGAVAGFSGAVRVVGFFGVGLGTGFFGIDSAGVPCSASVATFSAAFVRATLGRTAAGRGVAVVRAGALRTGALRTGLVRTTAGVVACFSVGSGAEGPAFCSSGSDVGGAGVTSLTYQGRSDIAGLGGDRRRPSGAAQPRTPGSRYQHGKEPRFPRTVGLGYSGVGITVCPYVNLQVNPRQTQSNNEGVWVTRILF